MYTSLDAQAEAQAREQTPLHLALDRANVPRPPTSSNEIKTAAANSGRRVKTNSSHAVSFCQKHNGVISMLTFTACALRERFSIVLLMALSTCLVPSGVRVCVFVSKR